MLLTRPRRQFLFGLVLAALIALVVVAVGWRRSDLRSTTFLSGWPTMSQEERSYYTHGFTEWLVVHKRERFASGGGAVQRRYRINPPGLMQALGIVAVATMAGWWAYRVLVYRLTCRGYCDYCGYNLTGLASDACPECGRPLPGAQELRSPS